MKTKKVNFTAMARFANFDEQEINKLLLNIIKHIFNGTV